MNSLRRFGLFALVLAAWVSAQGVDAGSPNLKLPPQSSLKVATPHWCAIPAGLTAPAPGQSITFIVDRKTWACSTPADTPPERAAIDCNCGLVSKSSLAFAMSTGYCTTCYCNPSYCSTGSGDSSCTSNSSGVYTCAVRRPW